MLIGDDDFAAGFARIQRSVTSRFLTNPTARIPPFVLFRLFADRGTGQQRMGHIAKVFAFEKAKFRAIKT